MPTKQPTSYKPPAQPIARRSPTKVKRLVDMLKSPEGVSVEELGTSLGWLPHTVRAALTGLRKKGHVIVRGQQGSVTVYRIGT